MLLMPCIIVATSLRCKLIVRYEQAPPERLYHQAEEYFTEEQAKPLRSKGQRSAMRDIWTTNRRRATNQAAIGLPMRPLMKPRYKGSLRRGRGGRIRSRGQAEVI